MMGKIFIRTYGCALNRSDSEVMAGLLKEAGFALAGSPEEADAVIINTCIVKGPTEQKFFSYLKQLKNERIIITGCLPQVMPEKVSGYTLVGVDHLQEIVEAVEETLNGNPITLLTREDSERLNLPHIRSNSVVEIVPISKGCLGNCAYCIVKKARGNLRSYSMEAIAGQARKGIYRGAREIWLTAQDTGCWGMDIGKTLPDLIERMIRQDGKYRIRIGMMNPDHLKTFLDRLLDLFSSRKLFRFLHIPLQSGDDDVLRRMNRRYSAEDYRQIVKQARERYPDMTIATDVICGFPGETEEQFQRTISLLKETEPDKVHISRFWERPGTAAAGFEGKLDPNIIKERSGKMASAVEFMLYQRNKSWAGWEGDATVDEKGSGSTWIARNYAYKPIIIRGDLHQGQDLRVRVEKAGINELFAIKAQQ